MSDERKRLPSASSTHRYAQCPGSFLLEAQCPAPPTSEDANIGKRIHAFLAGEVSASSMPPEELELAERCKAAADTLFFDWVKGGEVSFIREQRLWAFDGLEKAWSGKPDMVAVNGRRGLVVDYKTGRGDVDLAPGNLQLRALAVLAADEYDLEEVTVAIVQPLAGKPSTCVYSAEDLDLARNEMRRIMRSIQQPGQPRIPSVAACKYCRAKEACPEARAVVEALPAKVERDGREIAMTPEQVAQFLDAAKIAEDVIDAIRAKAKRMLEENEAAVPGWRLKPGVKREKVTDPNTVFGRFTQAGGTQEQFLPAVTISKTGLKDALRAAVGLKGKALDERLAVILDGCTETTTAAPSLVREKGDA